MEKSNTKAAGKLYRAVAEYVKSNGGMALVASGIQIQEWPEDGKNCFRVAVKIVGRKPKFSDASPLSNAVRGRE